MTLQQFIDKYNNVHIDEDGYYGAQCWDLVARYAREVVGCPSFPTVTGGAAGLFSNTAPVILQYFDRVANNPNDANQIPPDGAVIVWGTTWSPPYGHTALKTAGGKGQNMTVIEQNGNNPGGAAYIKSRNYTGVTGWLVPKKGTDDVITKEDVGPIRIIMSEVEGWNGNDIHSGKLDSVITSAWVGRKWTDFIWNGWNQQKTHRQSLIDNIGTLNAKIGEANGVLITLQQQVKDLGTRPTQEQLQALSLAVEDANKKAMAAQAELEKIQAQKSEDTQLLNDTGNVFQKLFNRLFKKG